MKTHPDAYEPMRLCAYEPMHLCAYEPMRLCAYEPMRLCAYEPRNTPASHTPSTTRSPASFSIQASMVRRCFSRSMERMGECAVPVSPMYTGRRNVRVCER